MGIRFSEAARRLPRALVRKGWSQRMLEREIPCSEGYVNHLIHGRRQPSAEVAARIEELLKIKARLWGRFEETVAA